MAEHHISNWTGTLSVCPKPREEKIVFEFCFRPAEKTEERMKVQNILFGCFLATAAAIPLAAQTPLLGNIEAPYPNLQTSVHVAGATYGPGAVAYGPVGTPLILTGSDLGASGTVQFIGYKNGAVDPGTTVQASVTMWSSTMLFLTVPSGAVSGLVKVITEGKTSVNGLPFIVTPGAYAGTCPASPPNNQLQIITSSLHDGTVGQAYSATLNASGGTTAYTWSLVSGTLPSGLSLNSSTGAVSGTPSSPAGPIDLTFQVVDSSSPRQNDQAVLSLTIESQTLAPATIYSYSATYDAVGNVTQYQDSIMGTWSFGYDSLNRLATGTPSSGPYNGQLACWSYDSFGNRTAQTFQTSACPTPETSVPATVSYNANNQVTWVQNSAPTGFSYDPSGNVTGDNLNQYLYDADGRICAVNSTPIHGLSAMTGYIYDAEGNRVAKGTITTMICDPTTNGFQLTESYVLGQGGEELTTLDGSNNWQRTNVYDAGKLLATYDVNGLHFNLTDPLGTRRMQVNGNLVTMGVPDTDIQSLPFGDGLYSYPDQYAPATADDATPLHFTGKERDAESGNDYFGARYYAATIGRFMSPDWSSEPEPVPYAELSDPQTLNLYSYGRDNPLTMVDPDGHCTGGGKQRGFWWCLFHESDEQKAAKIEFERQAILNSHNADGSPLTAAQRARIQRSTPTQIDQLFWTILENTEIQLPPKDSVPTMAATEDSGAQDKRLTSQEVENLEKNTGETAHQIKEGALGTDKNLSKYDLYKNSQGEIVAKPKGSSGPGEPTGYTTEHLRTPETPQE